MAYLQFTFMEKKMKKFAIALALTCTFLFAGASYGQCVGCGQSSQYANQGYATQTYRSYSTPVYSSPSYPAYVSPAPIRQALSGVGQRIQNAAAPRYIQGTTSYGDVYSAPTQPVYQQVTETHYKKVCNGYGCTYVPVTRTYMKRIR